jgi:hypothetical protein
MRGRAADFVWFVPAKVVKVQRFCLVCHRGTFWEKLY